MKTPPRSFFSAVILFLCCITHVSAQSYHFRNYSVNEGLPFIQVFSVFQDKAGYLWSGGYGGLSRFDGKVFTNFSPREGLPSHWVNSITEDASGQLWAGTIKGLCLYNGSRFRIINTSSDKNLPGDNITCLLTDQYQNTWVGTDEGLARCRVKGHDTVSIEVFGKNLSPALGQINCLFEDKKNQLLWIGTTKGAYSLPLNESNPVFTRYQTSTLIDNSVKGIVRDGSGNLLMGTADGLFRLDAGRFVLLNPPDAMENPAVNAMLTDEKGICWIGAVNGLYSYDGKQFSYYRVARDKNGNFVACMRFDSEGNLWLGTNSGLFRFRGSAFTVYGVHEGLNSSFIQQLALAHDSSLWVATFNGGISHSQGNHFTSYTTADGLPSNGTVAVAEDKNKTVWAGGDKGLARFNGTRFEKVELPDGNYSKAVNILYVDSRGRLWIGSENTVIVYENGIFTRIDLPRKKRNYNVYFFHEDLSHRMWICTYLGGVYVMDVKGAGLDSKNITEPPASMQLKIETCLGMTEDKNGWLYFATLDGVLIWDKQKMYQIRSEDNLSSDLTYFLVLDNNDNDLWVGSNQGLSKIDLSSFRKTKDVSVLNFGKEDGFTGVECNSGAMCRLRNGQFFFGTVNGLIRYDADEYRANSVEAKIHITGIKLFYNDTLLPPNALLDYDQNNITFNYTGICLSNPQRVLYEHKLEGFEERWSPASPERFTTYSNLPPGTYTFLVRSRNNEGYWNTQPARFTFTIATPYWKKLWFWLLLLGIASLGLFVAISYRIQQIKSRQRRELQARIELASVELKALRAQMNPHFIFNSLNSIQHFIINNNSGEASKYLNKFARLIRMILYNSEKSVISISKELDALKLYLELEALRFDNRFEYHIELDEEVDSDFFEIPPMLLQPYIENSILHGLTALKDRKGKLDISIRLREPFLVCTITDNGIGRKRAMELKQQMPRKDHTSMGMRITEDRLGIINRLHNSDLSLQITDLFDENGNASGTRVEIFIPVD